MKDGALPGHVKIGAHTYVLKYLPPEEMDPLTPSSFALNAEIGRHYVHYGSMYPGELLIEINKEIAPSMMAETIIHEILHAIVELAGLSRQLKLGREETIVQAIGHMLTQVLRDNPKVRRLFD